MKKYLFVVSILFFSAFVFGSKPTQNIVLDREKNGDTLICLSKTLATSSISVTFTNIIDNEHSVLLLNPSNDKNKANCFVFKPLDFLPENQRLAMFQVIGHNQSYMFRGQIIISCPKNGYCGVYLAPSPLYLTCAKSSGRACIGSQASNGAN
jgi:hypothetical protein